MKVGVGRQKRQRRCCSECGGIQTTRWLNERRHGLLRCDECPDVEWDEFCRRVEETGFTVADNKSLGYGLKVGKAQIPKTDRIVYAGIESSEIPDDTEFTVETTAPDGSPLYIDSRRVTHRCAAAMINHSADEDIVNCVFVHWKNEETGIEKVCIEIMYDLPPGTFLYVNYGDNYWDQSTIPCLKPAPTNYTPVSILRAYQNKKNKPKPTPKPKPKPGLAVHAARALAPATAPAPAPPGTSYDTAIVIYDE